jgi:hypothetical protein
MLREDSVEMEGQDVSIYLTSGTMEQAKKLSAGRLHRRYREAWHLRHNQDFWNDLAEHLCTGGTMQRFCAIHDIRTRVVEAEAQTQPRVYLKITEAEREGRLQRKKKNLEEIEKYKLLGVLPLLEHT